MESKRQQTNKERVLKALACGRANSYLVIGGSSYPLDKGFVPGHLLTTPQIGGSEGLRRVRELRKEGWIIEKRKSKKGNFYEYRLSVNRDEAQRIYFDNLGMIKPSTIYAESRQIDMF